MREREVVTEEERLRERKRETGREGGVMEGVEGGERKCDSESSTERGKSRLQSHWKPQLNYKSHRNIDSKPRTVMLDTVLGYNCFSL